MVTHFIAEFNRKHNRDMSANPRAIGRLRAACERAKRNLTLVTETRIEIDCLFEGIDFSLTITRARFEKLNMDLFMDCTDPADKCLKDAKMDKSDVHDVVLIGGSTRIPKVQQLLQDFFKGKELCKSINPDEAVAFGAAFHAAILAGVSVSNDKDVVLRDVTPLSLGVEDYHDKMCIVVPRNTTIPTAKITRMHTAFHNQTNTSFPVYEGERPIAKDNGFLGKFVLYDIPPAPKGVPKFDVHFKIDADGILTVSAELVGTSNRKQIMITNHIGRLSKEEINRMVKDADMFKAQDGECKKASEAKNTLENYMHQMRSTLRGCGRKVGIKDKRKLGDAIEKTVQWLDWNYRLADAFKFQEKLEELESICEPIIAKMHEEQSTGAEASDVCYKVEIIELD